MIFILHHLKIENVMFSVFFIGVGKYQEQTQPTNFTGKEKHEIKIIFHILVNSSHSAF